MKILIITLLFSLTFSSFAEVIVINKNSVFTDYLAYAALNNPGLQAAYYEWKADLEKVPQAKSLDEPMLEYEHFVVRMQERRKIGISQAVPWFGKLRLRGDIASKKALASYYNYLLQQLELDFDVSKAYYDYYYIGQAILTAKENIELLKTIEQTVLAGYRTSSAKQTDLLRVQVELLKLKDRLRDLQSLLTPASEKLNSLLNRPYSDNLPVPDDIEPIEIELDESQIISLAASNNLELKILEANLAASESGISLARRDFYPDFRFGVSVMDMKSSSMNNDDRNPVMLGVMLSLPLWQDKYSAGVREARNRYFAVSNRRFTVSNRINSQISSAVYDYKEAQRKIELYSSSLIPMASQSVNVLKSDFRAGKGDLTSLVDAQRLLLELELSYKRALADKAIAASLLNKLSGGSINQQQTTITGNNEESVYE